MTKKKGKGKGKGWHGDSAGHARAARKGGGKKGSRPKPTKLKVPGMRGKQKVPKGMHTNRKTGTRLYGSNIYNP